MYRIKETTTTISGFKVYTIQRKRFGIWWEVGPVSYLEYDTAKLTMCNMMINKTVKPKYHYPECK